MAGQKDKKNFLNKPHYEGGNRALDEFISQHLVYPDAAREAGITGLVKLRVHIDHKGRVYKTELLKGLGHGCDEEAARVAGLLQFSIEKNRNLRVSFYKDLNFLFKPAPPKASAPDRPAHSAVQEIRYTYVSDNTAGSSYSYTIPLGPPKDA